MGIMDSFTTDSAVKPTVTVSLETEDSKRVIDAALALKDKGCKNRGEFCRAAIMTAVVEVETQMGGKDKVTAVAAKHDPDGTRYDKRTRNADPAPVKISTGAAPKK